MRSWPLSTDEEQALIDHLNKKIDLEALVTKHSKYVESTLGTQSTHKAICPNPEHKNGEERTPSFYFSTETNTFNCFGCEIYGNSFDFISLVTGKPVHLVIDAYKKSSKFDFKEVNVQDRPKFKVQDVAYKLGIAYRDYLNGCKGQADYAQETEWVDTAFRRMDDRFACLDQYDYEQARNFAMQLEMELERRKV